MFITVLIQILRKGDCYAVQKDELYPYFERTEKALYCRGTGTDCRPFSGTKADWDDSYWIIESFK